MFDMQCFIQFLDGWKPSHLVKSMRLWLLEIHVSCIAWCRNGETENGMPFSGSSALKHAPPPFGQASGAAARSQLRPHRRCHCPTTEASLSSGGPSRTGDPRGLWQLPTQLVVLQIKHQSGDLLQFSQWFTQSFPTF